MPEDQTPNPEQQRGNSDGPPETPAPASAAPDPASRRPDGMPVGIPFEKNDPRINREGRPPSIRAVLASVLAETATVGGEGKGEARANAEMLARVAVNRALKGDFRFFREILHQIDGPPMKRITVTQGPANLADLDDEEFERLLGEWRKIREVVGASEADE